MTKPLRCDECNGLIDPIAKCCEVCGLEMKDIEEARMNPRFHVNQDGAGNFSAGITDARGRRNTNPDRRGYTCPRCYELFTDSVDIQGQNTWAVVEAKMSGHENAGTDLVHFNSKEELRDHIQRVHFGRRRGSSMRVVRKGLNTRDLAESSESGSPE